MGADNGGIDDQILKVWIIRESLEDGMPDTLTAPSAKAAESAVPGAEELRQVAPRCAGAHNPKDGFQKEAIVSPGGAAAVGTPDDMGFDPLPLCIAQHLSITHAHHCHCTEEQP